MRAWILLGAERRDWAVPFDDLVATGRPEPVELPGGEVFGASTIYTAGTTGKPKGARRRGVGSPRAHGAARALNVTDPAHVHLVAGPLYHSAPGGFALYAHLVGGTVVVMPKFDAEAALATIERHRCSSTFMAPTLLKRIVDLPAAVRARYDVSSMRAIVMAAAPCPMRVKEDVIAYFGPVLYEFYGSTELGINTILGPDDMLRKPGSCGKAAPGVELAVLDDEGRPVRDGAAGGAATCARYPGVFDEYYKNPDATRQTRAGRLVLSVGDVAYLDDEGFVYICDRKRDMIISGGVNIYPAEIEDALHRHPEIEDAAVFGVPDDDWGERVHAAVEPRPGAHAHRRGRRDLLRAAPRRLQGAARGDLPRRPPARRRGQARQAPSARALLGRPPRVTRVLSVRRCCRPGAAGAGGEKGPDARRRGPRCPRRTLCTLRACAALANEADGPLSAARVC